MKRRKNVTTDHGDAAAGESCRSSEVLSAEFVGTIRNTYKFDGVADFQFLQRGAPLVLTAPVLAQALQEMLPRNVSASDTPAGGSHGVSEPSLHTLPSGRQFSWMAQLERGGLGFAPSCFFPDDKPHRRSRITGYRLGMTPSLHAFGRLAVDVGDSHALDGSDSSAAAGGMGSGAYDDERDGGLGSGSGAGAGAGTAVFNTTAAKDAAIRLHYSLTRAFFSFQQAGLDVPVPSRPLETIPRPGIPETAAILRAAFAARPVWSFQALEAYLLQSPPPTKYWKFALPAVAYRPSSGIFRLCWIRLGYDPRTDRESRLWLPIEVRIPKDFWSIVPQGATAPNGRGARKVRFAGGTAGGSAGAAAGGAADGDDDDNDDGDDDEADGGGDDDAAGGMDDSFNKADGGGGVGSAAEASAGVSAGAGSGSGAGAAGLGGSQRKFHLLGVRVVRRVALQLADAYAANLLGVIADPSAATRWSWDSSALVAAARPTAEPGASESGRSASAAASAASSSSAMAAAASSAAVAGVSDSRSGEAGDAAADDERQATLIIGPDGVPVPLSRRVWRDLLAAVPAAPEWSFESAWLTRRSLLRARDYIQLLVCGFAQRFAPTAHTRDAQADAPMRQAWLEAHARKLKVSGGFAGTLAGRFRAAAAASSGSARPKAAGTGTTKGKGKGKGKEQESRSAAGSDAEGSDSGSGRDIDSASASDTAAAPASVSGQRRKGPIRASAARAAAVNSAAAGSSGSDTDDDSDDDGDAAGDAAVDRDGDEDEDEDEDAGFTRRSSRGRGRGRGRGRAASTSTGNASDRGLGAGNAASSTSARAGAGGVKALPPKAVRRRSSAAADDDYVASSDEGGKGKGKDAAGSKSGKPRKPKRARTSGDETDANAPHELDLLGGAGGAGSLLDSLGLRPPFAPADAAGEPVSLLESLGLGRPAGSGGGANNGLARGTAASTSSSLSPAAGVKPAAAVPRPGTAAIARLPVAAADADDGEEFEI